jgi:hypothetical protein
MANRNYPKIVTATTLIPFDNPVTYIPPKTVTGAVAFTKYTTNAQAGYGAIIEVIADGVNVPDLSAFYSIGSGTYDNTAGVVNLLTFLYTGNRYCVCINPVSGTGGGGGGGDTTPPSAISVSVENAEPNKVLIAYGETLDSGSVPATSAYTVTVNGSPRTVSAVNIIGANVKVTFGGAAILSTDSVTLDYVVPGSNPIQDVAGNDAAALTGVSVSNNVSGGVVFIPFNLLGSDVVQSPTGTWSSAGGGEGVGYTTQSMAANGKLQMGTSGSGTVLGLDTSGALEIWTDGTNCFYKTCVFLAGGNFYTAYEGVLSTTQVNQGAVGSITHFRMIRTGTTIKLQTSTDGTTFTDAYTYPGTYSGTLYAKGWISTAGTALAEVKGEGFA